MKKLLLLSLLSVYLTLVYISCASDVKADVIELRETMMQLPNDQQRADMLSLLDQIEQKVNDLKDEKDQAIALKEEAESQVVSLQNELDAKAESFDSLMVIEQALWEKALTDSLFYDTLKTRME